ncbi:MORN repeat-containing protein 1 [Trichoplax sp. H2]|nr:MORN repeat-containing protein 1 [Trichoplax sp. H2]|eukprot:RDD44078.1 MORN repeat-containing protein 1 [Trichoplax sp. H2]
MQPVMETATKNKIIKRSRTNIDRLSKNRKGNEERINRPNEYVGETKNQLRHGFGIYTYKNRFFKYEGGWHNGKKHGHGKLIMSDGGYYEGEFKDGEMDGAGFRKWSNGNSYTGEFDKGEINGIGIMRYADGGSYEGDWHYNLREGNGTLTTKNGDIYEGMFYNHKRHGTGTQVYGDGDCYEGDWILGLRQGHGVLRSTDGSIYEGQWRNDRFHGLGGMQHSSGVIYEGMWIGGRPSVETHKLVILGDDNIEISQGSPFNIEIMCLTDEGEPTQDTGRLLQITAAIKKPFTEENQMQPIIENESIKKEKAEKTTPSIETESYPISYVVETLEDEEANDQNKGEDSLNATQSDEQLAKNDHQELKKVQNLKLTDLEQSPSHTTSQFNSPVSPTAPLTPSLYNQADSPQNTQSNGNNSKQQQSRSKNGKSSEVTTSSSNSNIQNNPSIPLNQDGTADTDANNKLVANLYPSVSNIRTQGGRGSFTNLLLPPAPQHIKVMLGYGNNENSGEANDAENKTEGETKRRKRQSSVGLPRSKVRSDNQTTVMKEKSVLKKKQSSGSNDLLNKESNKEDANKRAEKSSRVISPEEKYCLPGDYIITIREVTNPPFLDKLLDPVSICVKVNAVATIKKHKKAAKTKSKEKSEPKLDGKSSKLENRKDNES